MIRPASAIKLPVAGFRRRREQYTGPSAQTMMTGTAVSATLAVGSRRSRIRLAERAPDASRQYHRLPNGQVVSKCALREIKKTERPGSPRTPQLPSYESLS